MKAHIEQPVTKDNGPTSIGTRRPRTLLPQQLPSAEDSQPFEAALQVPGSSFAHIVKRSLRKLLMPILTLTILVLVWWAIAAFGQYPT